MSEERKFKLNDFLAEDANKPVIQQFILFFIGMLIGPIAVFFVTQRLAAAALGGDGAVAGMVVSTLAILSTMGIYAVKAYNEECRDYSQQEKDREMETKDDQHAEGKKKQ